MTDSVNFNIPPIGREIFTDNEIKEFEKIPELPEIGEVEAALKKNENVREVKREIGKWAIGIGSFAAVTLAGILIAGTVLAIISNPVGWGIGVGLALGLVGIGIFLIAKYGKKWTDAVIPMCIGAAAGAIVVVGALFIMAGGGKGINVGMSGFHGHYGFSSGLLLTYWFSPISIKLPESQSTIKENKDLFYSKSVEDLKVEFSEYLKKISLESIENQKEIDRKLQLIEDQSKDTITQLYKKALHLVKKEKYKEAAPLLYRVQQSQPEDSKLNREFGEVIARAYPKAVHLLLKNMQEAPYYRDEANPKQALNLARSLYELNRIDEAKGVLSFAFSIAYKENDVNRWIALNKEGWVHYDDNKEFMEAAELLASKLFK